MFYTQAFFIFYFKHDLQCFYMKIVLLCVCSYDSVQSSFDQTGEVAAAKSFDDEQPHHRFGAKTIGDQVWFTAKEAGGHRIQLYEN